MRKSIFVLTLLSFFTFKSFAQFNYSFDFKLGSSFVNQWDVNQVLKDQDITEITSAALGVGVGMELSYDKYYSQVFLGLENYFSKKSGNKSLMPSFLGGLSLGYEVLNWKDNKLKLATSLAYGVTSLHLHYGEGIVDLDNIQANNEKSLHMRYNPLFLGADLKYEFQVNQKNTAISIGYWHNVNNAEWKNQYGTINNAIAEKANRFNITLYFPILRS